MPRKKSTESQIDPKKEKKDVVAKPRQGPQNEVKKKAAVKLEVKETIEKPKEVKKIEKKKYNFLLFDKWSSDIIVQDQGLKPYLNLDAVLVPFSAGRHVGKQFWKSKKHIVERLMTRLFVSGHKGKKHHKTSGLNTGKFTLTYKIIKNTFEHIEKQTKKNPVEVFIRALERGSPREGVATFEYGGVRYPKATDLAPQRRIDLALRWMTQGAFQASSAAKTKLTIQKALANELIAASEGEQSKSHCVSKKFELERQAAASR
jgi:small subunit ribosomal protein S7